MFEEYLNEYPDISTALKRQLQYLLDKFENTDELLQMAIDKHITPENLREVMVEQAGPDKPAPAAPAPGPDKNSVVVVPVATERPEQDPNSTATVLDSPYEESWWERIQNWFGEKIDGSGDVGDFFSNNWKWIAIVFAAIVILGVAWYFGLFDAIGSSSTMPAQAPATRAVEQPPVAPTQLIAIDVSHSNWLGLTQYVIMLFATLIIVGIPADEWRRSHQFQDSGVVFVAVGLIMCYTVLVKVSTGFIGPGTEMNFSLHQLDYTWALVCSGVALAIVLVATMQGGFDLTPLAGFFTILGSMVLLFGQLGAIQTILGLPDNPVLNIGQVGVFISLKDMSKISMATLAYFLLLTGVFVYFIELVRSVISVKGTSEKIFFALTSVVGIVAYFLFKGPLLGWGVPPMIVILIIILIGLVAAIAHQTFAQSNNPVGQGERLLRDYLIPPYDKVAFQLALGLLLIAITGQVF